MLPARFWFSAQEGQQSHSRRGRAGIRPAVVTGARRRPPGVRATVTAGGGCRIRVRSAGRLGVRGPPSRNTAPGRCECARQCQSDWHLGTWSKSESARAVRSVEAGPPVAAAAPQWRLGTGIMIYATDTEPGPGAPGAVPGPGSTFGARARPRGVVPRAWLLTGRLEVVGEPQAQACRVRAAGRPGPRSRPAGSSRSHSLPGSRSLAS